MFKTGTDLINPSNKVKNHNHHCLINGHLDICTSAPLKHGAMTNLDISLYTHKQENLLGSHLESSNDCVRTS